MYRTKLFAVLVLLSLSLCSGALLTKERDSQDNGETEGKSTTDTTAAGRKCASGSRWMPGPGTSWQWQLSGNVDTSFNVQVYDIDMFGASQTLIDKLHAQGRAVICYIDTAYEPGRPDSNQFTSAVLGNGIDGWPGQKWVDIRSQVVRQIMVNRIAKAASKGCDGIEMDDVDAYTNNPGFDLTPGDQLNFNRFLAQAAHFYDLSIALKNDVDQISALAKDFDFAINEQCYAYNECSGYSAFIKQDKAVFGVEYDLTANKFCPQANAAQFNWLKKGLNLDASMSQCCTTCTGSSTCQPSDPTLTIDYSAVVIPERGASAGSDERTGGRYHSSASTVSGFAFIAVIAAFMTLL